MHEDRGKISLQPLVLIVHTFSKLSSILDCSLFIRKIVKIVVCIINVWYKLFVMLQQVLVYMYAWSDVYSITGLIYL